MLSNRARAYFQQLDQQLPVAHKVDQRDALVGGGGSASRARTANRCDGRVQRGGQQAQRLGERALRQKRQRRAVQFFGGSVELLNEWVLESGVDARVAARQLLNGNLGQTFGGEMVAQQFGNCVGLLARHKLEVEPRRRRRRDERDIAHRLRRAAPPPTSG